MWITTLAVALPTIAYSLGRWHQAILCRPRRLPPPTGGRRRVVLDVTAGYRPVGRVDPSEL
jgi:hypothetical protein